MNRISIVWTMDRTSVVWTMKPDIRCMNYEPDIRRMDYGASVEAVEETRPEITCFLSVIFYFYTMAVVSSLPGCQLLFYLK